MDALKRVFMKQPKVYLAGGLKTDWQDRVIEALRGSGAAFYNPMTINPEGDKDMMLIACKEQEWLSDSDIIFAYLESTNPMPLGMYAEIGYACAEGKYIIFVDEWQNHKSRWLKAFVAEDFDDFQHGIEALELAISEHWANEGAAHQERLVDNTVKEGVHFGIRISNDPAMLEAVTAHTHAKIWPSYYYDVPPCKACEDNFNAAMEEE